MHASYTCAVCIRSCNMRACCLQLLRVYVHCTYKIRFGLWALILQYANIIYMFHVSLVSERNKLMRCGIWNDHGMSHPMRTNQKLSTEFFGKQSYMQFTCWLSGFRFNAIEIMVTIVVVHTPRSVRHILQTHRDPRTLIPRLWRNECHSTFRFRNQIIVVNCYFRLNLTI